MKSFITTIAILLLSTISFGQTLKTGEYSFGIKLAYDSSSNKLTGYFENYTGWDEENSRPKFSCIFYLEGSVEGQLFKIQTYYPTDKLDEAIEGSIKLLKDNNLEIKLSEEHGGCFNVQHFASEAAQFKLIEEKKWVQIRYVNKDKSHFYKNKSTNKKLKSYLVKGDFVCIEKIEGNWVYCTYFGKNPTKGWLKIEDLNEIN
jgi:hypothetical protein